MKKTYVLVLSSLFISAFAISQTTIPFEQQADAIFETWDSTHTPGVAAGIIQDGKIIYLKGFGSANMAISTSITPQTKFQLGELSKQFTSLAILILEEQDKISLDDDIRKYVQELPAYSQIITIRHLLNHSSGLHDIGRIHTIIKGTSTIPNQADAMALIASQETLAFQPGTHFSFHEAITESLLMAEIVARASGVSFSEFVSNNVFKPLGMKNSLIRDDSETIITGIAEPYRKENDGTYKKNEVRNNVIGPINAYSSAEDMSIWYLNFSNPKGAIGRMIQKLDTPVQLDNGKQFKYYWGKMTIGREFGHPERGLPIYWNFGLQGGYGSNIFRYRNQHIISFVLGNNNQYNGSLAMDVIDPLVRDKYLLPEAIDYSKVNTVEMTKSELKTFEGNYWFHPAGYASKFFVENDTLRGQWLFSSRSNKLIPISKNTFQQIGTTDEVRLYKFVKEGNETTLHFTYDQSETDIMTSYEPVVPTSQILQSYSGSYYNSAYTSLIVIDVKDGQLNIRNSGHKSIQYKPVKKDVFSSATLFMPALEFVRDTSNKIIGIKIDGDGVHSLIYKKAY